MFRLDFASTARRRPQELVASSFAQFYRQQHQCLYVSTVPSKSRRKDNSAVLELRHWRSGVWIVQVPWNCKTAHFRQPPYRVWSAFFHDLAAFTSRQSCESHSFLVASLKIELEDSEELYFSAKEKKTVNKLTVSWRQRALWRFKGGLTWQQHGCYAKFQSIIFRSFQVQWTWNLTYNTFTRTPSNGEKHDHIWSITWSEQKIAN